jgi:hypothetical protein
MSLYQNGDMTQRLANGIFMIFGPDNSLRSSSYGLPTRSQAVSLFMIGLEKTKAQAGEVSQSARALTLDDMHRLHGVCTSSDKSAVEQRWGIIRFVCIL